MFIRNMRITIVNLSDVAKWFRCLTHEISTIFVTLWVTPITNATVPLIKLSIDKSSLTFTSREELWNNSVFFKTRSGKVEKRKSCEIVTNWIIALWISSVESLDHFEIVSKMLLI